MYPQYRPAFSLSGHFINPSHWRYHQARATRASHGDDRSCLDCSANPSSLAGQFERLAGRIGRQKAIVAIARKLLVVVWHVLTDEAADRHAQPEAVARKLMTWGTRYGSATSQGPRRAASVRYHLDRLGLGTALETFTYGRRMTSLPTSQAVTTEVARVTG